MAELNRDMSPAEKAGYARALADLQVFGARMAMQGAALGGDAEPIPRRRVMEHTGRAIIATAEALHHTLR